MTTVTEYKNANQNIAQKCRMISENLLVKINTKRVYEELQFFDDQIEHKEEVQNKLYGLYHDIMTIMKMQFSGMSNRQNIKNATSGNRTRASRVAGENSTTEPTLLATVLAKNKLSEKYDYKTWL